MSSRDRSTFEYGDFQTPEDLAKQVCSVVAGNGIAPATVVEPTCGTGNFIKAALNTFPSVQRVLGVDINGNHVRSARDCLATFESVDVDVLQADFFSLDWQSLIQPLAEPLLIIGNPPWVTNSELAALGSSNLPQKDNFQSLRGIDAITGRSNFDISEWMIIQALDWMNGREAKLAMLCKTAVARRVLSHIWESCDAQFGAKIYKIDAMKHFDAAVDACLLLLEHQSSGSCRSCRVYHALGAEDFQTIGLRDGKLIADLDAYEEFGHLIGSGPKWRSGVKHDCSKLMELTQSRGQYVNGFGDIVSLEDAYVYPMLKSSDIANYETPVPSRVMLVPQRFIGENTDQISHVAPLTWEYLQANGALLDKRRSSIYRNKPRFSIFGVGSYSFSPWKVAVSGFYKDANFRVIGPVNGSPVMLDDTCYFLPCSTSATAEAVGALLNSPLARELFSTLVFADAKRPVTAKVLQSVDLEALARESGCSIPLLT